MKIKFDKISIDVIKESTDKRFHNESIFFYAVRNALSELGHDVIKKLMIKDGHLVSADQYYIRERKGKWAVWWDYHAIRPAYRDFNNGQVTLQYIK